MSPASFSRHPFPPSSFFFLPALDRNLTEIPACRVSLYRFTQLRIGELNGNKEEGRFQKVFDRDSLFRSVYCLNLDAIENRDCPWGQFSRISENEGEKKVEEEEERQKEKFERTSIERSVFDVARE